MMANVARNVTASVGPSILQPMLGGVMILVTGFSCRESRCISGFEEAIIAEE